MTTIYVVVHEDGEYSGMTYGLEKSFAVEAEAEAYVEARMAERRLWKIWSAQRENAMVKVRRDSAQDHKAYIEGAPGTAETHEAYWKKYRELKDKALEALPPEPEQVHERYSLEEVVLLP